jgi:hypothetical protein
MGIGWAMGALGLAEESPDYTEQLDKIDEDLQEIIGQLNDIEDELASINAELLKLDCSEQQTALTIETGRIDFLLQKYQSFVSAANAGGRTPNATLSDWADQVLAQGAYTSQTPMGQILTTMANQLIQPSSGAITACVQAVPKPPASSFGDTDYYDAVSHFTTYYYYYQVQGLMLLNEALHYKSWVAAGSPSDVSADSVSFVCKDPNAVYLCNQAGIATNGVYNALIAQFNAGGAPYTNDYFLMATHFDNGTPRLWVKSMEDFSQAAGDNCAYPLTSNAPCGITAADAWYTPPNVLPLTYRGYNEFGWVGQTLLNDVLNGWDSGTAGNFLETKRDFKNMKNKIIIAHNTVSIRLANADNNLDFVPFIDTDFDYSFQPGLVDDTDSFNRMTSLQRGHKICYGFLTAYDRVWYDWYTSAGVPGNRNNFYNLRAHQGRSADCGKSDGTYYAFSWAEADQPGWLASNTGPNARQYRWPHAKTALFTDYCTHGRSSKNAAGVWTLCGEDFTAWFENIVPRPPTCDDPSFPTCGL